jgi:hypothetical protein
MSAATRLSWREFTPADQLLRPPLSIRATAEDAANDLSVFSPLCQTQGDINVDPPD